MIGKGAQYLTAAGFGRYRITAASLGSLDLLDSIGWLRWATKRAIMDAFGVDGTAVIVATNAYLDGIAASDRAKATALAGFINEDPMMVCSLGLEPTLTTLSGMPVRWLYNNGTAYFYLPNYVVNQDSTASATYILVAKVDGQNKNRLFGYRERDNGKGFACFFYNNQQGINYGNEVYVGVTMPSLGVMTKTELRKNEVYNNDTLQYTATSTTFSVTGHFCMFAFGNASSQYVGNLKAAEFNVDGHKFVPFLNGEDLELLDLTASMESGTKTFATRSGSFTENYTLVDGVTPWTPSTP